MVTVTSAQSPMARLAPTDRTPAANSPTIVEAPAAIGRAKARRMPRGDARRQATRGPIPMSASSASPRGTTTALK